MNKKYLFAIMFLLTITFVSADCTICNETCTPCVASVDGLCTTTDMNQMYVNQFNFDADFGDITGWNTSCITGMFGMFLNSGFNQDISNWDISNVNDTSYMFMNNKVFNQNITSWNTSKVTTMRNMFLGSNFNNDITGWNTQSVTDFAGMFDGNPVFNQPIGNWNTSNALLFDSMFYDAISFNQSLNNWDMSNVDSMNYIFYGSTSFTQPLDLWNVSNCYDFSSMFANSNFNSDISMWNMKDAQQVPSMFENNHVFNQNISSWFQLSTSLQSTEKMFYNATAFNQDLGLWNVTSLQSADDMFSYSNLSKQNYDNLLNGWKNTCTAQYSVVLGAVPIQYTINGINSRNYLIDNCLYQITDGGVYTTPFVAYAIKDVDTSPIIQIIVSIFLIILIAGMLYGFIKLSTGEESDTEKRYLIYIVLAVIIILIVMFLTTTLF